MKILIIENDPINMKFTSVVLRTLGIDVFEAEDALTGIQIAKDKIPTVILMDIQLPHMDGFGAIRILKNDPMTCKIKIVATTAHAMKKDRDRILESGFDAYLVKPINYKDLLQLLKSYSDDNNLNLDF